MDQAVLVSQAHALTSRLDETKAAPRAVMWVHTSDTDIWRLWVVPARQVTDKREFYRIASEAISKHRDEMKGLDVGSLEFAKDDHPAMRGMARFMRMEGLGSATFQGNRFNGFYLPEGIVIRMALG